MHGVTDGSWGGSGQGGGRRTDEAHNLLDQALLVEQALALGVVLVAQVVRGLGRVVVGGVVLLVLLLSVVRALLGVLGRYGPSDDLRKGT